MMPTTAIVLSGLFLAIGLFLMWKIPLLSHGSGDISSKISVVIPARNEAKRIKPLLESLNRQSRSADEIIVVNDGSTDDTASIAEGMGARVISVQRVPEGWHGKAWACWQGAKNSGGELIVFLDADTWLEPRGLADIARTLHKIGGLLTVQPYHVTIKPYEQLSVFFNIVLMAGLNAFTPLGNRIKSSGGFGPCIACRRDDYIKIGGHEVARNAVLEDIVLAKHFTKAGLPVHCFGGLGAISFRMYPNGIKSLIEGWSKGFAKGAGSIQPLFLLLVIAWVSGLFSAFIDSLQIGLQHGLRGWPFWLFYGLYVLQVDWMQKRIGKFSRWASIVYPIPLMFFTGVMVYSLFKTLVIRKVRWKGRKLEV